MKFFTQLLTQLRELALTHRPGQNLVPPALLEKIDVKGCQIAYLKMGIDEAKAKNPIIFIHGFGGFFMDWPRVMTPLSKDHLVIALDLPGWGFSESRQNVTGVEDDADMILEFISKMKLSNVTVVALSYGAAVGWAMGANLQDKRTQLLKQFLFINPMPPFPLQNMDSYFLRSIFKLNRFLVVSKVVNKMMTARQYKMFCKETLKNGRLLETSYLKLGFLVLKQPKVLHNLHLHARGAYTIDWKLWEEKIRGIKLPVYILQGTHDKIFSIKSARYLQSLIVGSFLEVVQDSGHAMCFDKPVVIIRKIKEIIDAQDPQQDHSKDFKSA